MRLHTAKSGEKLLKCSAIQQKSNCIKRMTDHPFDSKTLWVAEEATLPEARARPTVYFWCDLNVAERLTDVHCITYTSFTLLIKVK